MTFLFGGKSTTKHNVTLTEADLKLKLYLCCLALNPSMYNTCRLNEKPSANRPGTRWCVARSERLRLKARVLDDDVFVGQMPDRMITGLLDSRAFNGDLEYYLFAFQLFGLTQTRQVVDSEAYTYEALGLKGGDQLKDWRGYERFLEASGARQRHGRSMLEPDE